MTKIDKQYFRDLNAIVDELFEKCPEHWTLKRWAREAGVCYKTVLRLNAEKTRYPQFRTITKLARSVDCEILLKRTVSLRSVA